MIEIFKWSYDKLFSNGDNLFLDISQLGEERMRFSGLIRLVRQVCKYVVHSWRVAIDWLLGAQYRDLKRGCSN